MHGGWCWRPVEALLREAGHVAHAPTLTGMGDRAHLLSPQVGLDTHVRDVVATLRMEDVRDGVLVLHSYAGVLAGPVVEQAQERVGRVVAMGAFLVDPTLRRTKRGVDAPEGPETPPMHPQHRCTVGRGRG